MWSEGDIRECGCQVQVRRKIRCCRFAPIALPTQVTSPGTVHAMQRNVYNSRLQAIQIVTGQNRYRGSLMAYISQLCFWRGPQMALRSSRVVKLKFKFVNDNHVSVWTHTYLFDYRPCFPHQRSFRVRVYRCSDGLCRSAKKSANRTSAPTRSDVLRCSRRTASLLHEAHLNNDGGGSRPEPLSWGLCTHLGGGIRGRGRLEEVTRNVHVPRSTSYPT